MSTYLIFLVVGVIRPFLRQMSLHLNESTRFTAAASSLHSFATKPENMRNKTMRRQCRENFFQRSPPLVSIQQTQQTATCHLVCSSEFLSQQEGHRTGAEHAAQTARPVRRDRNSQHVSKRYFATSAQTSPIALTEACRDGGVRQTRAETSLRGVEISEETTGASKLT